MAKRSQIFYGFAPETGVEAEVLAGADIPYLGDPDQVQGIISLFVSECIEKRLEPQSTARGIARYDRRYCVRLANIFLGRRENLAQGVPTWNKPGAIDVQIAKDNNITEKSSTKRMTTFFAMLLINVLEQIEYGAAHEQLPEQYEEPIMLMVTEAVRELCGLPEVDDEGDPIEGPPELVYNTDEDDEAAYEAAAGSD